MRSYDNNDDSIDKAAKAAEIERLMKGTSQSLRILHTTQHHFTIGLQT
jgi:hypothetical protein